MQRTTIYGHSDDCIEVKSTIKKIGSDEFNAYDEPGFLHFGDGTIVRAEYTKEGKWAIVMVKEGPGVTSHEHQPALDDEDNYTDKLTIYGDLKSVQCWYSENGPTRDELLDKMEDVDWRDLGLDRLKRIWAIVQEDE